MRCSTDVCCSRHWICCRVCGPNVVSTHVPACCIIIMYIPSRLYITHLYTIPSFFRINFLLFTGMVFWGGLIYYLCPVSQFIIHATCFKYTHTHNVLMQLYYFCYSLVDPQPLIWISIIQFLLLTKSDGILTWSSVFRRDQWPLHYHLNQHQRNKDG